MEIINTLNSIIDTIGILLGVALAAVIIASPFLLCYFIDKYTV